MKNTKHTEMNDSSIEQDKQENLSQSKRKILTSIGVTSGVVGASALVPSTWVKPAVNSVILPAHAQSTPPVNGTTPTPTTTPMGMGPTTMMPTTMMPTTMMPTTMMPTPQAAIWLNSEPDALDLGVIMVGGADTIDVRLSTMPSEPVTVTVTADITNDPGSTVQLEGGPAAATAMVEFTTTNYADAQRVTITSDMNMSVMDTATERAATVMLTASGGGYDDATNELKYTVGYFVNEEVTMVVATKSGKSVTVTWVLPSTQNTPTDYVVDSAIMAESMIVSHPGTEATFSNLNDGTYAFTVQARYSSGNSSPVAPVTGMGASITIP